MNSSDDASGARGDPIEYPDIFAGSSVASHKTIDAAIRYLMPNATHSTAPALFDYRVSSHTVRAWRMGWRGIPQWAKDMLDARIAERTAPGVRLQAAVRMVPIGRPLGWNKGAAVGLGAWRAAGKPRRESGST